MDPRLFDVLHDPGDEDVTGGVAHGVDVDLDGVFEEAVDQDGATLAHAPSRASDRAGS